MKHLKFKSIFVCMFTIMLYSNVVFSDQIIFNADFEADTPGTSPNLSPQGEPAGDSITISDISSVQVVGSDSIFPSNSIEITATSYAGPAAVYLYGLPDSSLGPHSTSGTYEFSWKACLLSLGEYGGPLVGLNSNGVFNYAISYRSENEIYRSTPPSGFQLLEGATYQIGVPQSYQAIVNFDTGTYDLIIDNILVGDDLPLRSTDGPIHGFAMTVGVGGQIRIDDIIIIRSQDTDGDMIADVVDNCPNVFNPYQEDTDDDGLGDACVADNDNDGVLDDDDLCPQTDATGMDYDGDGCIDIFN